ncbi:MAG: TonB-dependent receptor, partial [Pseudomonadota bacterium]
HRMLISWETTFDLVVNATWRHVGETELFGLDRQAASQRDEQMNDFLEERNYLDLSANYNLTDSINLRAGVNNVFAKDPPLSTNVGTGTGNNNTYPGLFDVSRYFFAGVNVSF